MKKLQILMLEDSEEDLMLVLNTLQESELDFDYAHVSNEREYLNRLRDVQPDIILSDYGLSGYNGLAALRDKREMGVPSPFILVTGSLPDDIAVECLKAGADDYILKDRLNRLPDAIRSVMDRQHAEAERRRAFTELIRSQKRLEAAERMAKVGNWEWHLGTGEIIWSDEMYNICGADHKTYRPTVHSFMELILPDEYERSFKVTQDIASGKSTEAETTFQIRSFRGDIKMIRSIYKGNGKMPESGELKVFGTMQDITVLHRTEMELRKLTEELEERVNERTRQLQKANEQLERKNAEMTDSINYAQLIQKALLAKLDECRKLFPKSFVLWKPRDIVSGDFYWQYHNDRYDYIAVVDCTGHGVPGALMSMIGHQMLNHTVIDKGISEPAEILNELDRDVDEALFNNNGASVNDGMDLVLCRIDREQRQICFAGALRPLFLVNKEGLTEHPGSRNPIGNTVVHAATHSFTQKCVRFKEGDTIYLTSDGYYSQFGGPKGKKIMKSRFKRLLQEVGGLPIDEQYRKLNEYLAQWQGDEPQVDDILVIGIQF
ncbi:MAG: SpoIIE family protein phosphatase [Flavobacteriales bacterium]|nr:SpoIIE family protein phosphatase [Flavobacteriales bacterium]